MSLNVAKVGHSSVPMGPLTSPVRRRWGAPFNQPMVQWQGRRVWLIGASSGIGLACAKALHAAGANVVISARNVDVLSEWAEQSQQQGPSMTLLPLDVTDALQVRDAMRQVAAQGPMDMLLYCAGHYRAHRATNFDLTDMLRHQEVNYVGALHVLHAVLPPLLAQGQGHISLVASVAGYRGLPQSLAYGPTKAALIHLAEALYLDVSTHGLGVSVVNPGFVETPLTAQNTFHMPALMQPEDAARAMLHGWAQGAFEIHYPKRFTRWLKLMRLLPYRVYFALVRRATGL